MTKFSLAAILLAVVFWWQVLPPLLASVIPFEWWMDVRKIEISDAKFGEPITVKVDRTILRDFNGAYRVDLRKETETGFAAYCWRGAENVPYRANAVGLNRDLNWWLGIPPNAPCDEITPGRYYTIVDYYIPILGGYVTLHKSFQSNVFTVF